ncbi:MAG: hypothetical protein KDB13_10145, partial [Microthrixaceae bacterium]|nr:hypothetical protein [Microthrixaceae bacterium]
MNLGWLVGILLVPGGIAHFGVALRTRVQDLLARAVGLKADSHGVVPTPDPLHEAPDNAPNLTATPAPTDPGVAPGPVSV